MRNRKRQKETERESNREKEKKRENNMKRKREERDRERGSDKNINRKNTFKDCPVTNGMSVEIIPSAIFIEKEILKMQKLNNYFATNKIIKHKQIYKFKL